MTFDGHSCAQHHPLVLKRENNIYPISPLYTELNIMKSIFKVGAMWFFSTAINSHVEHV
jgi:hypothetical protein